MARQAASALVPGICLGLVVVPELAVLALDERVAQLAAPRAPVEPAWGRLSHPGLVVDLLP